MFSTPAHFPLLPNHLVNIQIYPNFISTVFAVHVLMIMSIVCVLSAMCLSVTVSACCFSISY